VEHFYNRGQNSVCVIHWNPYLKFLDLKNLLVYCYVVIKFFLVIFFILLVYCSNPVFFSWTNIK
jgi:hypothetical protein